MVRNLIILLGVLYVLAIVLLPGKKPEVKNSGIHAYEILHTNPDSGVVFKTYPTPVARPNPKDSERFIGFDVSAYNGCVASILLSYEVNKDGSVREGSATTSIISPCLQ